VSIGNLGEPLGNLMGTKNTKKKIPSPPFPKEKKKKKNPPPLGTTPKHKNPTTQPHPTPKKLINNI